jgi:hypothetical protein
MSTQSAASRTGGSATDQVPENDTVGRARQFRQALIVWGVFFVLLVLFNGTIPFALGVDLRAWTASPVKSAFFGLIFYGLLFLVVPLVLIKGWDTVRRPGFLLPLLLAVLGIASWRAFWPGVALAVAILAYLHARFDLSGYGVRSRGWAGDLIAIALMGILGLVPVLMQGARVGAPFGVAAGAALSRLFANPASSIENLFYYGFLTERVSYRAGKWLTPLLIGVMYTAHEMSNPEYWYGGMSFGLVFVGVVIWAAIYLWRRSAVVIWLGDGMYRFVMALF